MSDLRDTYNRIAEAWHAGHQGDDWWVAGTNQFASLLPSEGTVLDVGCGAGTKSNYLAGKGLQVTGIDFAENMVAIAKREVPDAAFLVADFVEDDLPKESFDGIFMQASLLHVPKQKAQKTVDRLASLLKSSGLFYIAVKEQWSGQPEEENKIEGDVGFTYERFFSYFTEEEIKTILQAAGCEIVWSSVESAGKTRWIQTIGRKRS